jgi:hypothetical protein
MLRLALAAAAIAVAVVAKDEKPAETEEACA